LRCSLNLVLPSVERPIVSGPPDGYAVRQLHPLPVNAGEGSGATRSTSHTT